MNEIEQNIHTISIVRSTGQKVHRMEWVELSQTKLIDGYDAHIHEHCTSYNAQGDHDDRMIVGLANHK